jgi:hypothetical protein
LLQQRKYFHFLSQLLFKNSVDRDSEITAQQGLDVMVLVVTCGQGGCDNQKNRQFVYVDSF